MPLLLVGVNHTTAPLADRERFALSREQGDQMLDVLSRYVPHAVVLATCNRTELYITAHNTVVGAQHLERFLADWAGMPVDHVTRYLYVKEQWDAVRHLFEVAAGLDSMILGEEQILGQVRSAMDAAAGRGVLDPILTAAFQRALRAGRRARAETNLSRNAVSISSVAVRLARERFGGLSGVRVLVISAGEAGKLATRTLVAQGVRDLRVTSRSLARAHALAVSMGGTAVPFEQLDAALVGADLVITATGAPDCVLTRDRLARAVAAREGRPLLIVDIAVPRDVEPEAASLPGVSLYNLDDIERYASHNLALRALEVDGARAILDVELSRFQEWWRHQQVAPVITALQRRAEAIREAEVRRTLDRLPSLSEAERERVEAMTRAIVKKLLHQPLMYVKEERDDGESALEVLRALFALDTHRNAGKTDAVALSEAAAARSVS